MFNSVCFEVLCKWIYALYFLIEIILFVPHAYEFYSGCHVDAWFLHFHIFLLLIDKHTQFVSVSLLKTVNIVIP